MIGRGSTGPAWTSTASHPAKALHRLIGHFGELLLGNWFGKVASSGLKHPPHGVVLEFIWVNLSIAVAIQSVEEIIRAESSAAAKSPPGRTSRSPGALGQGHRRVTGDTDRTCCPERESVNLHCSCFRHLGGRRVLLRAERWYWWFGGQTSWGECFLAVSVPFSTLTS